ncbi:hypothetical protein BU14_0175s0002 [Porphyra umbilicalis]|uniref:Protein kinase domain-containing protein n=1 Tax=Porphyra umbilicalis TaxID=2786 RepID=A0A1X6P7E6_PORUM|nr:hypothetical protein BU14_0175s0002 [Porphyra umbilicalis]|eukprot:OSX76809.1 hypothetical protein BU14_0175s0002 [Porphyra umbilicalis]
MASLAAGLAGGGGEGGGRLRPAPPLALDQLLERLCEHLERSRDQLALSAAGIDVAGTAAARGRGWGAGVPLGRPLAPASKWTSTSSPALRRSASAAGGPVTASLRAAPGSASLASGLLLPSSAKRVIAAAASKKADLTMLVSLAEEEEDEGLHGVGAHPPATERADRWARTAGVAHVAGGAPAAATAAAALAAANGIGGASAAADATLGTPLQASLSRSARSVLHVSGASGGGGGGANGYGDGDSDARAVVTLPSDVDEGGEGNRPARSGGDGGAVGSAGLTHALAVARLGAPPQGGMTDCVDGGGGRDALVQLGSSARRRPPAGPDLTELAIRSPGSSYLSQRRSSLGLGGDEAPVDNPHRLRRDYSRIFNPDADGGIRGSNGAAGGASGGCTDLYRMGSGTFGRQPRGVETTARRAGPPGSLHGDLFGGASTASLATVDYGDNLLGVPSSPAAAAQPSMLASAGGELYLPGPPQARWSLGKQLGEGGASVVFLATSTIQAGLRTAVKVIAKRPRDAAHALAVSKEVFSYRLLALAGGHEHIVELLEVGEDAANVYMFMELLEGGELFSRISGKSQYTEKDAARLTAAMLSALAFCHRLNITHRDVKAENFVFVSAAPEGGVCVGGARDDIKLIDFGISHYDEDPNEQCVSLSGTPMYVAPEVLLRQPYRFEVDMWSLGIIVYIMLVGNPPFEDTDLVQLVKKVKYRTPSFDGPEWVLISDQGKRFLTNLLDKDPETRMTAEAALHHPWLANRCHAAPHNPLDAAQANIRKFGSRNRWRAVIQGVRALNRIQRAMHAAAVDEFADGTVIPQRRPFPGHPPPLGVGYTIGGGGGGGTGPLGALGGPVPFGPHCLPPGVVGAGLGGANFIVPAETGRWGLLPAVAGTSGFDTNRPYPSANDSFSRPPRVGGSTLLPAPLLPPAPPVRTAGVVSASREWSGLSPGSAAVSASGSPQPPSGAGVPAADSSGNWGAAGSGGGGDRGSLGPTVVVVGEPACDAHGYEEALTAVRKRASGGCSGLSVGEVVSRRARSGGRASSGVVVAGLPFGAGGSSYLGDSDGDGGAGDDAGAGVGRPRAVVGATGGGRRAPSMGAGGAAEGAAFAIQAATAQHLLGAWRSSDGAGVSGGADPCMRVRSGSDAVAAAASALGRPAVGPGGGRSRSSDSGGSASSADAGANQAAGGQSLTLYGVAGSLAAESRGAGAARGSSRFGFRRCLGR